MAPSDDYECIHSFDIRIATPLLPAFQADHTCHVTVVVYCTAQCVTRIRRVGQILGVRSVYGVYTVQYRPGELLWIDSSSKNGN